MTPSIYWERENKLRLKRFKFCMRLRSQKSDLCSMVSQQSLSRLRLLVDGINGSLVRRRKTVLVYCPPARNETIAQMECSLSAIKEGNLFLGQFSNTINFQEWGEWGGGGQHIGNVAEAATSKY